MLYVSILRLSFSCVRLVVAKNNLFVTFIRYSEIVSKMLQFRGLVHSTYGVAQRNFLSTWTSKQVRLASRPVGLTSRENWNVTEENVSSDVVSGGIVVQTKFLSLDPAMRGWLNDAKSYIPPVAIGEVMRAGGVGVVVASKNPKFSVGDSVTGMLSVQEYASFTEATLKPSGIHKIDLSVGSYTQWLNTLGMPGMTGYFGLMDVGKPVVAGQTLVVSSAMGAVGQVVGQLGKIYGMRVVGIAGGASKCESVVKQFGFDACIDYKQPMKSFYADIKKYAPDGVDIYFDNVGGDILDCMLTRINRKARIVVCGAISQYNTSGTIVGPKNYLSLLVNRARMEGMVVFDYARDYPKAIAEMSQYLKEGKMKSVEDVVAGGIDKFPEALNMLFTGANVGKLVLDVSSRS
jgi:NADPH-dependent curcumin reductase CurA